jgi:hypothetical protein
METVAQPGLEATAAAGTAEAAASSADAAKSALEQVEGIVAALPENLRFSRRARPSRRGADERRDDPVRRGVAVLTA